MPCFFYDYISYCFVKLLLEAHLIDLYKVTAELCQQELVLFYDLEVREQRPLQSTFKNLLEF